jgi:hypothetical protein
MAAKLIGLTHKIVIQLCLVAESCTIYSFRSRRPVWKLLDTPSYSLLRGAPLKYSHQAAMHLAQRCCHCWKLFGTPVVEQLVVSLLHLFECLQYPEIFFPFRQTLFLKTARSHSELNQGNRMGVTFQ